MELVDDQRHRLSPLGWQHRLARDGSGGEVQQRAADQSCRVLADIERIQVDDHEFPVRHELAKVDRRARLAHDLAGHAAAQVLVDLGLDRIDDLQLESLVESLKIPFKPLADDRVAGFLQQLSAEARPLQHCGHVQDRVLSAATSARVLGTHGLVRLEKCQHREAEGILHARSPVAVELPPKDAQRVGGGLIAVPAQSDVQQVDAKRPTAIGHVKVDHIRLPLPRDQAQRRHR